jgi:hypothetical protein
VRSLPRSTPPSSWPKATANAKRSGLDSTRRAAWHRAGRSPLHFVVLMWRPPCVALTTLRVHVPVFDATEIQASEWNRAGGPGCNRHDLAMLLTSNRLALTQPLKFNDEVFVCAPSQSTYGRPAAERRKRRRELLLFLRSYNVQSTATLRGLGVRLGPRKSQIRVALLPVRSYHISGDTSGDTSLWNLLP